MSNFISRREVLARLGTSGAGALLGANAVLASQEAGKNGSGNAITVAGRPVELSITFTNPQTMRVTLLPVLEDGRTQPMEDSLILVKQDWPAPALKIRSLPRPREITWGNYHVSVAPDPLAVSVRGRDGKVIQQLQFAADTGGVSFAGADRPLFGLGEGGPQLDRRGSAYPLRHGQGGPQFSEIGGRVPVQWVVGADGRALFFHQPYGSFDLTSKPVRFEPAKTPTPQPLDLFVVVTGDPRAAFAEYARLTGFPHMPPLWALGYQQSHRTLASREEILTEAKTFREKKLPCDLLIYLGTGFCPSGWNKGHGSFTFNPAVFPDPQAMLQELHQENFKTAVHVVIQPRDLHGTVRDSGPAAEDKEDAANYWSTHLGVLRDGVDGWWPDEGDWLSPKACLVRNRMYWEGPQLERPNLRPYALHRNGNAGMQRYGWLWSGDIDSTWDALTMQVKVGINTGASGMPFWGTDTGGFITTPEFTGELYARWFQFSAFCPLFRSHGRTWKLRLPWGWNTGDYGPTELSGNHGKAGLPDAKELHNAQVEPICRKYLDLRYRLMPYSYTIVREAHDTGLPIMRAMWLHYPDDPKAVERGDQYLWGRDILVAPVTEKGAASRRVYLPGGFWYDFWTGEKMDGGREVSRSVDLVTMPLYVRAGTILPRGPVKQYTAEKIDKPLELTVYPGADGEFLLYEDDGLTFNYEEGEFTRTRFTWNDAARRLTISLPEGARLQRPAPRDFVVRLASGGAPHKVTFNGHSTLVRL